MTDWTDERHKAARAACDAATPEPWVSEKHFAAGQTVSAYRNGKRISIESQNVTAMKSGVDVWHPSPEDCDFIALARTDLPDALDEIVRLQKEIELNDMITKVSRSVRDYDRKAIAHLFEFHSCACPEMDLARECYDSTKEVIEQLVKIQEDLQNDNVVQLQATIEAQQRRIAELEAELRFTKNWIGSEEDKSIQRIATLEAAVERGKRIEEVTPGILTLLYEPQTTETDEEEKPDICIVCAAEQGQPHFHNCEVFLFEEALKCVK